MSPGDKSPLDQALDVFVYAPVGLALTARENLSGLIEKGRERVSGQVALARLIGQFAVAQGEKEARKLIGQAGEALLGSPGGGATADSPPRPDDGEGRPGAVQAPAGEPSAAAGSGADLPADRPGEAPVAPSPAGSGGDAGRAEVQPAGPARSGAHLAIPGYDTLSASQVVQRLAGLAPEELDAVESYEASTRGRRTILSRVAQLRSGRAQVPPA